MKKIILTVSMLCLAFCATMAQDNAKRDKFIDNLLLKMTLEEKLGQMNLDVAGDIVTGGTKASAVAERIKKGELGGVFNIKGAKEIRELQEIAVKDSRLGIPLIVGMDVIHGYETIFPIPLALSCSWDIPAIEQSARIAAKEASADGIMWTYSPMVDISVEPRWGRVSEGSGEDPYLGSEIARAMVRGYQGDFSKSDNIMACLKHYALYGAAEAGRDYNTVDMSRVRMYNQYFPPYKAAVEEGVASVMTSFNIVDGIPATANKWLIDDVLRKQWGFDKFVVTDYASIFEMQAHGAGDLQTASVRALKAGTDMDMCAHGYIETLKKSLEEGKVTMAEIDNAVRRILEAKYLLGLFDDPYKFCDKKRRAKDVFTPENRKAARELAAETFVLLKNEGNILPLKKQGKIALVGPLADTKSNMSGTWVVAAVHERYNTLRESMAEVLKGTGAELLYAQGCNICADEKTQIAAEFGKTIPRIDAKKGREEALAVAKEADVIICAMGETADMSGESSSRATLELMDEQMNLLKELAQLGKPIVLLNFSGRPTVMTWEQQNIPAIMNVWFGGSEAADAICDVVFGEKNPSGRLTMTMPQSIGQVPLYYNHMNTGRPVPDDAEGYRKFQSNYFEVRNGALYPFGYGLSYTTVNYGKPAIGPAKGRSMNDLATVTVTVSNTGSRATDEVVQLYIHDIDATIVRPVKELKGFQRVHLEAGESKEILFELTRGMLSYYDGEGNVVLEPGKFDIMIGPNSRDVQSVGYELK
ncbi:MAG: beta-glucosidase BglX [Bacteroidaceae bacterium]|nr:beta-glucosidase BglX [Bacteroidaceae bacterium]